jgi:hypothetical protein
MYFKRKCTIFFLKRQKNYKLFFYNSKIQRNFLYICRFFFAMDFFTKN